MVTKQDGAVEGGIVSGGQTQEQINHDMGVLVGKFPKVFKGLGRATGVPDIHIEMYDSVPPVQQKQHQIPFQCSDSASIIVIRYFRLSALIVIF